MRCKYVAVFLRPVNAVLIMLLITDNTNIQSRRLSVVKYVINNIMSTALTVRRKTATYLHLMRELLYNIDWPSGETTYVLAFCVRIGISCALLVSKSS